MSALSDMLAAYGPALGATLGSAAGAAVASFLAVRARMASVERKASRTEMAVYSLGKAMGTPEPFADYLQSQAETTGRFKIPPQKPLKKGP